MNSQFSRIALSLAAVYGFVGVAAGAFGAHALREKLSPRFFEVWQTAAHYQLIHACALFGVALALHLFAGTSSVAPLQGAAICFAVGVVLFSGSLYALALTEIRVLGAVTPFGGVGFLVGWVLLGIAALKSGRLM